MKFTKGKKIFAANSINDWWKSHTMAPSAILLDSTTIRVYLGCWDENGISRIGYVDVDATDPLRVKKISENPVINIGEPGTFDENGVFPAHAYKLDEKIYLYYTGFQLGQKIRHYNFGGLAIGSINNDEFARVSKAPILDRKNEGLLVRAGQSVLLENNVYKTVYSAGSEWISAGGKMRPTYNIFYQDSENGITYKDRGEKIIEYDKNFEHGLGRPQIVKLGSKYYIFYTRRTLDMKYFFGCAESNDCISWRRIDDRITGIAHSDNDWDSEMIYFPSVVSFGDKTYMFYSGNNFGETGFGFAELIEMD